MAILYVLLTLFTYVAGCVFALRRRKVPVTLRALTTHGFPGVRDLFAEYRNGGFSALRRPDTALLSLSYTLFIGFFALATVLLILRTCG